MESCLLDEITLTNLLREATEALIDVFDGESDADSGKEI